jgi:dTDP-4-dehydrorhamnose 3,5-epimerase
MTLPAGVFTRELQMHRDERGWLTEIFRSSWLPGLEPVQWNALSSAAGVLRGVHVHPRHDDYLVLLQGRASVGLRDLRRDSPTHDVAALVELSDRRLTVLGVPRGVAHGLYFHEPSVLVYAVDAYWSLDDELTCHWADPELGIPWPVSSALTSRRDAAAPPLRALLAALPQPARDRRT